MAALLLCHMKVQMEMLMVGSGISHSWNKRANKTKVIMMLHHLTQPGDLGLFAFVHWEGGSGGWGSEKWKEWE